MFRTEFLDILYFGMQCTADSSPHSSMWDLRSTHVQQAPLGASPEQKIILILKKTFFPNQVIKPFLVFFQLRKQVYQERALENNNKENYSTFTYIYTSAVKPLIANGIFKTKLFQGSPWHRHHYKVLRDVGLSYNLLTIFFGDVFPRQRVQFPGTTLAQ